MILLEELNPTNLSERTKKVIAVLKYEIERLEAGDERNPPTQEGNEKLAALVIDYQQLVQRTRKYMLEGKPDEATRKVANKLERSWRDIYHNYVMKYKELVFKHNETHENKIKPLDIRMDYEIKESVKYFDY